MNLTWLLTVLSIIYIQGTDLKHSEEIGNQKDADKSNEVADSIRSFSRPYFRPNRNKYMSAYDLKRRFKYWMNLRDIMNRWWSHNKPVTKIPTTPAPTEEPVLKFEEWLSKWDEEADAIECGFPEIEPRVINLRIVGGTEAIRGSWPWMVSMKLVGQHFCGGVLISREWVATSAHCLLFMPGMDDPKRWEIRLGRFDPGVDVNEPESEQRFNISGKPVFHDGIDINKLYSGLPVDHDIVLLKLDRPATITTWVKPICLPKYYEDPKNRERCVIIGYGQTVPNVGFAVHLRQAVVPIVEYSACQELNSYHELLTPRMICAGYEHGGIDSCKMDSGGPLQCFSNGRWIVSGITSWGDAGGSGCAKPLRPGVYTKITSYVPWIHRKLYEDYTNSFKRTES